MPRYRATFIVDAKGKDSAKIDEELIKQIEKQYPGATIHGPIRWEPLSPNPNETRWRVIIEFSTPDPIDTSEPPSVPQQKPEDKLTTQELLTAKALMPEGAKITDVIEYGETKFIYYKTNQGTFWIIVKKGLNDTLIFQDVRTDKFAVLGGNEGYIYFSTSVGGGESGLPSVHIGFKQPFKIISQETEEGTTYTLQPVGDVKYDISAPKGVKVTQEGDKIKIEYPQIVQNNLGNLPQLPDIKQDTKFPYSPAPTPKNWEHVPAILSPKTKQIGSKLPSFLAYWSQSIKEESSIFGKIAEAINFPQRALTTAYALVTTGQIGELKNLGAYTYYNKHDVGANVGTIAFTIATGELIANIGKAIVEGTKTVVKSVEGIEKASKGGGGLADTYVKLDRITIPISKNEPITVQAVAPNWYTVSTNKGTYNVFLKVLPADEQSVTVEMTVDKYGTFTGILRKVLGGYAGELINPKTGKSVEVFFKQEQIENIIVTKGLAVDPYKATAVQVAEQSTKVLSASKSLVANLGGIVRSLELGETVQKIGQTIMEAGRIVQISSIASVKNLFVTTKEEFKQSFIPSSNIIKSLETNKNNIAFLQSSNIHISKPKQTSVTMPVTIFLPVNINKQVSIPILEQVQITQTKQIQKTIAKQITKTLTKQNIITTQSVDIAKIKISEININRSPSLPPIKFPSGPSISAGFSIPSLITGGKGNKVWGAWTDLFTKFSKGIGFISNPKKIKGYKLTGLELKI